MLVAMCCVVSRVTYAHLATGMNAPSIFHVNWATIVAQFMCLVMMSFMTGGFAFQVAMFPWVLPALIIMIMMSVCMELLAYLKLAVLRVVSKTRALRGFNVCIYKIG